MVRLIDKNLLKTSLFCANILVPYVEKHNLPETYSAASRYSPLFSKLYFKNYITVLANFGVIVNC